MLYIVDGTGAEDDATYRKDMSGGMCDLMAKDFGGRYYRGPTLSGSNTYDIAQTVYQAIKGDAGLKRQNLFLAGHSRGGAAVIRVAQLLKQDGLGVDAMFLFDAVDRTMSVVDVQIVPANVKRVFHARRDRAIVDYFGQGARDASREFRACAMAHRHNLRECEEKRKIAQKYSRLDDAMKLRMRFSNGYFDGPSIDFDNCGTGLENNTAGYEEKFFLGSHGAIGGSFFGAQDGAWKKPGDAMFFEQIANADRAAVSSVSAWMIKNYETVMLKLHNGVRTERLPPAVGSSPHLKFGGNIRH